MHFPYIFRQDDKALISKSKAPRRDAPPLAIKSFTFCLPNHIQYEFNPLQLQQIQYNHNGYTVCNDTIFNFNYIQTSSCITKVLPRPPMCEKPGNKTEAAAKWISHTRCWHWPVSQKPCPTEILHFAAAPVESVFRCQLF